MVMDSENILIIDNGAHNIKIGMATEDNPRLIPNSIVKAKHEKKRVFIAQEQEECTDKFSLFYVRPIERGYIVNYDVQQQIWEKSLNTVECEPSSSKVILTDNNYLIPCLPDASSEILFEYFDFQEVFKGSACSFVAEHSKYLNGRNCIIVIDCGFSCTKIAPYVDGLLIQEGVVRIDVGGKALTNKLKDWISYRQLNVMEETHIINECKEDVCFVSMDFQKSLVEAKRRNENKIIKKYMMPDFHTSFRGVVKEMSDPHDPSTPSIHLGVERFAIPEILFNPSDIEIDQMGISEAVIESLRGCPENLRAILAENIVVVGGSACFPGFRERLLKEVRSMLPYEFEVNVSDEVADPQTHSWKCAAEYSRNIEVPWLNRKEWNERGDSVEFSKFFRTLLSSDDIREQRLKRKDVKMTSGDV